MKLEKLILSATLHWGLTPTGCLLALLWQKQQGWKNSRLTKTGMQAAEFLL